MSAIKQHWKQVLLITILTGLLALGINTLYAWQRVQKENNLILLQSNNEQEVYILGTIHNSHYQKNYNYSLADIGYVIDTIKPDLLLVETRQVTFDSFGALDGPSEMVFSWCYGAQNNIIVKGIDWWQVASGVTANNSFNTAYDKLRDDEIYKNIKELLPDSGKVLIICGMTHRVAQTKRFTADGYEIIAVKDFWGNSNEILNESFHYPKTMSEAYKAKANYFKTDFIKEVENAGNLTQSEKDYWLELSTNMVESCEHFLQEVINRDKLYK